MNLKQKHEAAAAKRADAALILARMTVLGLIHTNDDPLVIAFHEADTEASAALAAWAHELVSA